MSAGEVRIDKASMAKLRNVPGIFKSRELVQGLKKILLKIERIAKQPPIPVDTGRLKSSITTGRIQRLPNEISGEIGTFGRVSSVMGKGGGTGAGTNVFYAPYVEYGTRFMRAQPFLEPALEQVSTKYAGEYIKEAIESAWNRIVK